MRTCWTVKRQRRILELISELEAGVIDGFVVAELVLLAKERKAKEKEDRFKRLEKEVAAEYEAATHVVPPVPTLSAFVE